MTKKLSTQPYKGTRDFYPQSMSQQNYLFDTMRMVVERYGYEEYNASILEETDLYRAKSGEEIVNEQTYSFTDRGGRDVTIRPEMTPTVARMIAAKRKELVFPLRWYSIPNLLRYERPQRGRLREHWQLNVDIFGVESQDAEIEVVSVANSIMKLFGATSEDFIIKINNRQAVDYILQTYLSLDSDEAHSVAKLIDRMHKVPRGDFEKLLSELVGDDLDKLLLVLDAKSIVDLPDELQKLDSITMINTFIQELESVGIDNCIYDPALMRGFDYYTGIVFEVFDTHPDNNRSLFGGGRYDDLVGIFGVEPVSAVGFGMGDVTIQDFLDVHELSPEYATATELKICILDNSVKSFAREIASELREGDVSVVFETVQKKPAQHIKSAEKHAIPFILFIGEDEMQTGLFKLKDLESHEEIEVSREKIILELKNRL